MKNSNDTIGNRTRDLPAFSAVPQPTAPPRAPCVPVYVYNVYKLFSLYTTFSRFGGPRGVGPRGPVNLFREIRPYI